MGKFVSVPNRISGVLLFIILTIVPQEVAQAQKKISFGIHADPGISWFTSDIKETSNDGIRPGFNFGLTFNSYFTPNYSFSTGITLMSAGGRLTNTDTISMDISNSKTVILPGIPVMYKIRYLSIPIGLKLQTNQIGYVTFFSDLGLDPKVVIGGKTDIPYLEISDENAADELKNFNLSYHVTLGIEYSLGGTTALIFGVNYENNFFDITKDNGDQPFDKISHKILSLKLGVNF